jgi:hypothetical protein
MAQRTPILEDADLPAVYEPAWEEGRAMFDEEAPRLLGISGQEFLDRCYDAREFRGSEEGDTRRRVNHLIMLIPFARPDELDAGGRSGLDD